MVYVISKKGKTLMPTEKYAKVRIMIKQGKAKVIRRKPFTIQLLYDTTTYTQHVIAGDDPGRKHTSMTCISEKTADMLISSELETRNKEVAENMKDRKMHRLIRRRNLRMRKKRKNKANGTYYKATKQIRYPKAKEPVPVKHIKSRPVRFLNRRRPKGWLTPTAKQLLETHINYLNLMRKLVPIDKLVLEYNTFDTQKMITPEIHGFEYQNGKLKGYKNAKEFIYAMQEGKCLLCGSPIDNVHHVLPKSDGGSNRYLNYAGLCRGCHRMVHRDKETEEKLKEIVAGRKKEYDSASILNTIMPYYYEYAVKVFGKENVIIRTGNDTKELRGQFGLNKTHCNDSYALALSEAKSIEHIEEITPYEFKQYRRHNRSFTDAQRDRLYKKDGQIVAKNRSKRETQLDDSLEEYKEKLKSEYGKKEAQKQISALKVYRAVKRVKPSAKDISASQGCTVLHNGQRKVVKGIFNKSKYILFEGEKGYVPLRDCKLLTRNTGIVCL